MEYHSHFNKTPVSYIISLRSLQGEKVIKNRDNSRRLHLGIVNNTAHMLQIDAAWQASPLPNALATQTQQI